LEEFSLYVLDITMNSVRAGADKIGIELKEDREWLDFTVTDNGCGMSAEMVNKLSDPFFTTRKTRAVGLGVPFLKMLAEQTDGSLSIESREKSEHPDDHGTKLTARFGLNHIDFIPLGNMIDTVMTLIQGYPDINFTYDHITPHGTVHLSCEELKAVLGDDISLANFEVLEWIRGYLTEGYEEIDHNKK
jgi:hypothetical protein